MLEKVKSETMWMILIVLVLAWVFSVFLTPKDKRKLWKLLKNSLSLSDQKPRRKKSSQQKQSRKKNQISSFVLPEGFKLLGEEISAQKIPSFNSERDYLNWVDGELRTKAEPLIDHYCKRIGFAQVSLVIKAAKSKRWHCKKGRGTSEIMINRVLVFLPEKYLEEVIVHEVAHLKFPHHQKDFRDLVIELQPENKILNKELNKQYGWITRNGDIFGMKVKK